MGEEATERSLNAAGSVSNRCFEFVISWRGKRGGGTWSGDGMGGSINLGSVNWWRLLIGRVLTIRHPTVKMMKIGHVFAIDEAFVIFGITRGHYLLVEGIVGLTPGAPLTCCFLVWSLA